MKYYVPVGPGGMVFRLGMFMTGMMGSLVYWRACRRREASSLTGRIRTQVDVDGDFDCPGFGASGGTMELRDIEIL